MSGLVISLRPYEKVLIGGVAVQNGKQRTSLRVCDEDAGVLRLSEAIHPDQVRTPLTRAYFAAQTVLSGDAAEEDAAPLLTRLLSEAADGFSAFSFADEIERARRAAAEGRYHRVMKTLRPLLSKEAALFAEPAGSKRLACGS